MPQLPPHLPLSPIREKPDDESDGEFDDSLPPLAEIPEETSCLSDNPTEKLEELSKTITGQIEQFSKSKPVPQKQPLRQGTLYRLKKYHSEKRETVKLTSLKRNTESSQPIIAADFIFNLFDFYNINQEMGLKFFGAIDNNFAMYYFLKYKGSSRCMCKFKRVNFSLKIPGI